MINSNKKSLKDITENDSIIIRAGKPIFDEGLKFAKYFNETAEGFFISTIGGKAFKIIANAYIESSNEYSFENVAFAEHHNVIVGMVSGYTFDEKQIFLKNPLNKFSEDNRLRIRIFSAIGNMLSKFLGPKEKGDFYLQAIIVDTKLRGKGVGMKLMNYIEDKAINKKSKFLSLDVSCKNEKAKNLYKLQGMKVESDWPNILILPHIFSRMTKIFK